MLNNLKYPKRGVRLNILEVNNLYKYYGKYRGILDVSFEIPQGMIFGFIGPNGAGKSTTIRTILSFIHPSSGSATIFGLDCFHDSKKIKQRIGYIPSEVNYYDDMKVIDLLRYSAKFYHRDCSKRTAELCEKLDIETRKRIGLLSSGNKKKLAIVQALLHEPELLILDEPTNGLDPLMQNILYEILLEENKKGVTIFFSSHVLSEVQKMCHRVAIIKEGRIIKIENINKLRSENYKRIKVEFSSLNDLALFELEGATAIEKNNNTVEFLFSGEIKSFLEKIKSFSVYNLWIEDPALEEVFLHYYNKETD